MLVKLIVFFVDLVLASAIIGTLYAVYLIAATGTFFLAMFYIFKGEMGKNYDLDKDRGWVLESSNATENPVAGNGKRVKCFLDASPPSSPQRKSQPFEESNFSGTATREDFQNAINN